MITYGHLPKGDLSWLTDREALTSREHGLSVWCGWRRRHAVALVQSAESIVVWGFGRLRSPKKPGLFNLLCLADSSVSQTDAHAVGFVLSKAFEHTVYSRKNRRKTHAASLTDAPWNVLLSVFNYAVAKHYNPEVIEALEAPYSQYRVPSPRGRTFWEWYSCGRVDLYEYLYRELSGTQLSTTKPYVYIGPEHDVKVKSAYGFFEMAERLCWRPEERSASDGWRGSVAADEHHERSAAWRFRQRGRASHASVPGRRQA